MTIITVTVVIIIMTGITMIMFARRFHNAINQCTIRIKRQKKLVKMM